MVDQGLLASTKIAIEELERKQNTRGLNEDEEAQMDVLRIQLRRLEAEDIGDAPGITYAPMSDVHGTKDVPQITAERGVTYGDFRDNAKVAQNIKDALRLGPSWDKLEPFHREALDQMAGKMSRIVSGDPHYPDNWMDIAGFGRITAIRCDGYVGPDKK